MMGAQFNAACGKTKWKDKILDRANCKFDFEKANYDNPEAHYYVPEDGANGEAVPDHPNPVAVWCSVVAKRDIYYGEGLHIDYPVDPVKDGGTPVTNDDSSTAPSQSDLSQGQSQQMSQSH